MIGAYAVGYYGGASLRSPMAAVGGWASILQSRAVTSIRIAELSLSIGLFGLLAMVALTQVTRPPSLVTGWRIAIGFVVLGLLAMGVDAIVRSSDPVWASYAAVLVAGFVLIEGLYRVSGPVFDAGGPSRWSQGLFLIALAVFLVGYPDPRRLGPGRWVLFAGFGVVVALFVWHLLGTATAPTWPIWAVVVAGISLFVLPRFVPRWGFFAAVAGLAALATVPAVVSLVNGEFSFWFADVERWAQTIPLVDVRIAGWYGYTSVFNNVNVFGLLTFAGVGAGIPLVPASVQQRRPFASLAAGALTLVSATGLVLSNSGAAWLAAFVAVSLYGVYLVLGRRAMVPAILGGSLLGAVLLWVTATGRVPVDDSGRFDRWGASLAAYLAAPVPFGHGFVSTAEFVGPYLATGADTPHNSYFDMLIRIGSVGLAAYLAVVLGPIVRGLWRYRDVHVGILALTLGWAIHHLFESYTIFQWTLPGVLAALTLGYLLWDGRGASIAPGRDGG